MKKQKQEVKEYIEVQQKRTTFWMGIFVFLISQIPILNYLFLGMVVNSVEKNNFWADLGWYETITVRKYIKREE